MYSDINELRAAYYKFLSENARYSELERSYNDINNYFLALEQRVSGEIKLLDKKIKALEDKFNKDRAIMSEQELGKIERTLVAQKRDLKRNQDEFREDIQFRRNEELGKIQKRVVVAIQKIAKENNYDVILGEGVVFASPKVDISGMVIDYLKKEGNSVAE